jgi:hypothetical protein
VADRRASVMARNVNRRVYFIIVGGRGRRADYKYGLCCRNLWSQVSIGFLEIDRRKLSSLFFREEEGEIKQSARSSSLWICTFHDARELECHLLPPFTEYQRAES